MPKSPLGQAIADAARNWEALSGDAEQGSVSIDNNLAERTLRPVAVGRNNWGVTGSAAGPTAAVQLSEVGTRKPSGSTRSPTSGTPPAAPRAGRESDG